MKVHLHKQPIRLVTLLACFAMATVPVSLLHADSVIIHNTTSAEANTAGNTAENGEIVEGESRSEVHVETTVDGETVESVHKVATSTDGEANASVNSETRVNTAEDGTEHVETHTETNVGAEVSGTGASLEGTHDPEAETQLTDTASPSASGTNVTARADATTTTSFFNRPLASIAGIIRNLFSHVFSFFT